VTSAAEALRALNERADPSRLPGMSRFGIDTSKAVGVPLPEVRRLARSIGRDHELAAKLWRSKVHEARLLATMVEDPKLVTKAQMESWILDVTSWDLCDQLCGNLLDRTSFAYRTAATWSRRDEEFVKRAGFALMASLAVLDKAAAVERFSAFLAPILREATDERNFVRKAVNWALRQIGKRNRRLNGLAIETAREIRLIDSRSARWIGTDALRELTGDAVQKRLRGN
jgi:3-methyladenine DNA glycosylase AlkD